MIPVPDSAYSTDPIPVVVVVPPVIDPPITDPPAVTPPVVTPPVVMPPVVVPPVVDPPVVTPPVVVPPVVVPPVVTPPVVIPDPPDRVAYTPCLTDTVWVSAANMFTNFDAEFQGIVAGCQGDFVLVHYTGYLTSPVSADVVCQSQGRVS